GRTGPCASGPRPRPPHRPRRCRTTYTIARPPASLPDLHDRLAEVPALEHPVERVEHVVEAVDDLFLVLHVAALHPGGHVAQEVVVHRLDELRLDEAADRE